MTQHYRAKVLQGLPVTVADTGEIYFQDTRRCLPASMLDRIDYEDLEEQVREDERSMIEAAREAKYWERFYD